MTSFWLLWGAVGEKACHPERSEGPGSTDAEILRCAQDDRQGPLKSYLQTPAVVQCGWGAREIFVRRQTTQPQDPSGKNRMHTRPDVGCTFRSEKVVYYSEGQHELDAIMQATVNPHILLSSKQ
ncbi:MAG TPA: hypothetical protein VFN02_02835 [Ktedonobacteraceae bacterium]|nr:hypothetical protein [Ktedonobacteraceae bacterium]